MPGRLRGLRVLVVEDEVLVFWLTQDMLEEMGCLVLGPMTTVAQALSAITAQEIDAAVLDINLNGQLSYPIADALARKGVPYIFVTGYDIERRPAAYRDAPALQKPLHRKDLARTLASVLPPTPDVQGEATRA
ncbi:MAG: response regulator [Caulobacter sp.]|nr:response regulator [Caulobacter sp.]